MIGGGYIGAELAQMFARAGVEVTLVCRSRLLPEAEPEIGTALTGYFMDESIAVISGITYRTIRKTADEAKAAWLAYAVAISLEAKKGYGSEYHPIHAVIGSMLDIDVAAMWRPTAENFFDRVSKTSCLAALTEVGGSDLAARYAASKKADLAKTC